jgi:hypothetical protein
MHYDDAIARQTDVEFQTVGAEREAPIERRDRVLGSQRAAASVCKHKRPGGCKEGMSHASSSV